MDAKAIFLLFIAMAYGYNVDTDFPIIYSYRNTFNIYHSYFGYTVYLYHESVNNTSWLIVGAPRGNYTSFTKQKLLYPMEPGVVYRCTITYNKTCEEIKPRNIETEKAYIAQYKIHVLIKKQYGWFGGAVSIDRSNGILTVCAPRTIISILNDAEDSQYDTMQGMCYSGKVSSNALFIEDENLAFHNFTSKFWYNPMYGFSIHYASARENENKGKKEIKRIIGKPMHENYGTVDIKHKNKRISIELPLNDELSQFGHSVESGCFFEENQLLYVSGAPDWQYVGQVAIIDPGTKPSIIAKLYGTDTGEFFGASLAVGDLNNDGLDDLLIGAPYWGQDNGKVYAYFGTLKGQFGTVVLLYGAIEGAHFGYALASGDLDADGFDDIIVGAPWEESGVIYIYNGGPNLKQTNLQVSERIEAISLALSNTLSKMERFGFSTSTPVDIDGNGYLDIPVGAYKSGHAIVLRSKPVIKTELVIRVAPNVLERDAEQFLIETCPRYDGYNIERVRSTKFRITITVDEQYQRTKETYFELKSYNLNLVTCLQTRVNISRNIREFIEPISIFARHHFVHSNTSGNFCKYCPVERRDNKLDVAQILLPFNIGCGTDTVCNSNISGTAKFHGVRDNNTWVIGSTDINLEVSLKNHGEPAYLTTLEFTVPKGVILRSILPSCQEDTSKETLMVFCEAGNPLWKGEEKSIILDLDMKHLINGSLHNHKLNFNITIKTRSTNQGTVNINKTLNLISEVSLSLNGKANEETYYLSTMNDNVPNISFQHTYQVYKLGATPIEVAQLVVKIPTIINNSEPLVHIYKPQLYVSGERFECFSEDALLDTRQVEIEGELLDQFDMHSMSSKLQQSRAHVTYEVDTNESSIEFYDVENIEILRTVNENLTTDVLYMNCSSSYVNCTTIVCDLNALQTLQDIGKLLIKLVLNLEKLKDISDNNGVVLKFATEATVEIIKPAIRLPINGTRFTMEIVTMLYNISKTEGLKLWIILVSVLVGLLFLFIFVAILRTLGFFKRKREPRMKSRERQL
ncbi:integrin alpha-8-like isoform X2 [Ptiloglossa arizonensis]|uniref:integrin alpha-8-like isoform X2 n=1 Tax=Ptiloglossa arizonensis TaxID=3350558 RepID=UPI003F9F59C7